MTTDASQAELAASVVLLEARIDKLTQALLHVAGALWVARDRQAVLEQLLIEAGVVAPGGVDGFGPGEALTESLAAERDAFVAGVIDHLAPKA